MGQIGHRFFFKTGQKAFVGAPDPAGRGIFHRFIDRIDAVLVPEPGHRHIELKHPHGPQDVAVVQPGTEDLNRPLLSQLQKPLAELLGFQRILQTDPAEMFGRKIGNTGEFQRFLNGEGIADFNGAMIVDADNVAGIGFFNVRPVLRHENGGIGKCQFLSCPVMKHFHAPRKSAGANSQKSNPVAMRRIHIGLNLEHKS